MLSVIVGNIFSTKPGSGRIRIPAGSSDFGSGRIRILTGSSDFGSGRIRIQTGSTKSTGYPAGSGSGSASGAPLEAN